MSMWGEVVGSLQAMTLWQLLFAFVACTGYALAQGRLVSARSKAMALAAAALSAFAFVAEAERWVDGFMLVAVALAGLGAFAAMVWLLSRLLGLTSLPESRAADPMVSLPPPGSGDAPAHGAALPAAPRTAPSH